MQFALVLKSGPEYKREHVYRLADNILAHHPGSNIVCLSDLTLSYPSIERIPLSHYWPGWWSKIELFRPGLLTGPTLYLDIDTVVVDKINVDPASFTMLPDVYNRGSYGSGAMAWTHPPTHIYEKFKERHRYFISAYNVPKRWGDQAFIRDHLGQTPNLFDDQFRSYKVHCKNRIPPSTSVVYFHGRPRPWDVDFNELLKK
jgi:hypothetical protein